MNTEQEIYFLLRLLYGMPVKGIIAKLLYGGEHGIPPQLVEGAVPVIPSDSTSESPNTPGEAPTGGLGNDILRTDTWQYVAAAAQGRGCDQPLGTDTKIVVLQQPQMESRWKNGM